MAKDAHSPRRASTGIAGLDDILGGGLPADHLYVVEGDPGTGKTTLSLQFLLEGVKRGERTLFITLSETDLEMHDIAASHGWDLEGINLFELSAAQQSRTSEANTLFHPSEVELNEVTQVLLDEVERIKPARVVIDSLSELRLLAQNPLRFRRQILALKQYFVGRNATALLVDDRVGADAESQAHSVAHGVIELSVLSPEYGAERRRLRCAKLRGVKFRGGYHDFVIDRGGLKVFPRLIAAEHRPGYDPKVVKSDLPELDALLGGGLTTGTSTLIMGPAGSGKTTIAMQYMAAAAARGEKSAAFLFDENINTMLVRADGVGINLRKPVDAKNVFLRQLDPAEVPLGQFIEMVRHELDVNKVKIVVIDSINGYIHAMPGERFLTLHLHELLMFLAQAGVTTILVMAQHGMMGKMESQVDISYLSDTVLLLRYFEAHGAIRLALSAVKKRTGQHERTIRELRVTPQGLKVGKALTEFQGVLSGVPAYVGQKGPLMDSDGK